MRALSRQLWSMAASSFANPGIRDMKSKFPEEQSQLSAGRLPGQGFLLVSKASVAFPNPWVTKQPRRVPGASPPTLASEHRRGRRCECSWRRPWGGGRSARWILRPGNESTRSVETRVSYQDKLRERSSAPFDSSAGRAEDCRRMSPAILRSLVRFRLEGEGLNFVALALNYEERSKMWSRIFIFACKSSDLSLEEEITSRGQRWGISSNGRALA